MLDPTQQPRHSNRGVPSVKQSSYSPDLNLMNRFMFRHIKLDLRGEEFDGPEELSKSIQRSIRHISGNFLVEGLKKLRSHLDHVIQSQGEYILFMFEVYRVLFVLYHSFWDTLVCTIIIHDFSMSYFVSITKSDKAGFANHTK